MMIIRHAREEEKGIIGYNRLRHKDPQKNYTSKSWIYKKRNLCYHLSVPERGRKRHCGRQLLRVHIRYDSGSSPLIPAMGM